MQTATAAERDASHTTATGTDLATHVARLFYDRHMSKVEIGERLSISRFRVARLIDQAREEGLVRIVFREAAEEDRVMARAVEERFGLDLCAVAATGADDVRALEATAGLAARIAAEFIGPGDVIGIAWGSTLAAVADAVPRRSDPTLTVVQIAGSSSRLGPSVDSAAVSRRLAERLGAAHRPLFAPAIVDDAAVRAALVRQPDIARTIAAFDELSTALVGIGTFAVDPQTGADVPGSSLLRSGVLAPDDVARLRRAGAVGDLVVHPFDAAGRFVVPALADRAVAIDIAALRRVPRVIAVAAGAAKGTAIRGALATGLIDVLITDRAAAAAVLEAPGAEAVLGAPQPEGDR
jgi:DNA-binding transcriptional regulator LsrR (DeoR family)